MANYYIRVANESSVELWSTTRLPFEPKGWVREMRDELRCALWRMHPHTGFVLSAVYISPEDGFFDIENVLLYNVGSSSMGHLCFNGLSFERLVDYPPECPVELDEEPRHYHRYGRTSTGLLATNSGNRVPIAWWDDLKVPHLSSQTKPHVLWTLLRKHNVVSIVDSLRGEYELELTISVPQRTNVNVAGLVKPVLDGVVSAFHVHDGSKLAEVSERLSHLVGVPEAAIEEQLMRGHRAIFGPTNLVHPRGQGVQWSPADHLCRKAAIIIVTHTNDPAWSISGRMYQA